MERRPHSLRRRSSGVRERRLPLPRSSRLRERRLRLPRRCTGLIDRLPLPRRPSRLCGRRRSLSHRRSRLRERRCWPRRSSRGLLERRLSRLVERPCRGRSLLLDRSRRRLSGSPRSTGSHAASCSAMGAPKIAASCWRCDATTRSLARAIARSTSCKSRSFTAYAVPSFTALSSGTASAASSAPCLLNTNRVQPRVESALTWLREPACESSESVRGTHAPVSALLLAACLSRALTRSSGDMPS